MFDRRISSWQLESYTRVPLLVNTASHSQFLFFVTCLNPALRGDHRESVKSHLTSKDFLRLRPPFTPPTHHPPLSSRRSIPRCAQLVWFVVAIVCPWPTPSARLVPNSYGNSPTLPPPVSPALGTWKPPLRGEEIFLAGHMTTALLQSF